HRQASPGQCHPASTASRRPRASACHVQSCELACRLGGLGPPVSSTGIHPAFTDSTPRYLRSPCLAGCSFCPGSPSFPCSACPLATLLGGAPGTQCPCACGSRRGYPCVWGAPSFCCLSPSRCASRGKGASNSL